MAEPTQAQAKTQTQTPMQMQVLAKANVLGCPIDAGFMRSGDKSTMIVYGKTEPTAPRKSLAQLVNELGKMVTFYEDESKANTALTDALPEALKNIVNKIEFQLKEVYFVSSTTTTNGQTPSTPNKTSEFAFWFDIYADKLTEGWPITVEKVSIKLWSTTNTKILSEMDISSMQELLNYSQNVQALKPA